MSVVLLALFACGSPVPPPPAEEPPPAAPPPVAQLPDAPVGADYAVHEWGLISLTSGALSTSTPTAPVAATPPKPVVPKPPAPHQNPPEGGHPQLTIIKKPIVYFHPGPTFDAATRITATVTVASGALREVWPTPDRGAQPSHTSTWTWSDVQVQAGATCDLGWAPAADAPVCTGLTGPVGCEAAELTRYLGDVPGCLDVGGVATPVLLYNAQGLTVPPPLSVEQGPDGRTLVNDTDWAFGDVWVWTGDSLLHVTSVAAHARVHLRAIDTEALLTLLTGVHAAAMAQGLDSDEANAFVEAWQPILEAPTWEILSFYPPEAVDRVSQLTFVPPPREVKRALAFTIDGPPAK